MLFAGRTFSADALRGLRRPSHKTQYDSETVTLSTLLCLLYLSIENQLSWEVTIDQLTTVYGYCVLGK